VVAVSKISSKYVGTTRSLATKRTLGIPKLLKCINKAQPELSRSHVIKNTAPELEPCLGKHRALEPEPEPLHFYKSSAALVIIITMLSFMRVSYKLVFHQNKCISAIKRIRSTTPRIHPRLLSCIFVFLFTAMHVWSLAPCVWEWRRYTIQLPYQARNQLGTPGGAKSFLRVAQIFQTMSNAFKLCPTYFSRGGEKFSRGLRPPCAPLVAGLFHIQ